MSQCLFLFYFGTGVNTELNTAHPEGKSNLNGVWLDSADSERCDARRLSVRRGMGLVWIEKVVAFKVLLYAWRLQKAGCLPASQPNQPPQHNFNSSLKWCRVSNRETLQLSCVWAPPTLSLVSLRDEKKNRQENVPADSSSFIKKIYLFLILCRREKERRKKN